MSIKNRKSNIRCGKEALKKIGESVIVGEPAVDPVIAAQADEPDPLVASETGRHCLPAERALEPAVETEPRTSERGSVGNLDTAATPYDEAAPATPSQKLHRATFDGDPKPDAPQDESPTGDSNAEKTRELLEQIGRGLDADNTTNMEKLTIARKYGALLLELKEIVSHGMFKKTLKDRFPTISYSKCNRWMWLAEREIQVAETIEKYPHVAWGPKKMIDFLSAIWESEEPIDDDEDEACGDVNSPLDVEESNITAVEPQEEKEPQLPHAVPRGATAGPVVEPVATTSAKQPSEPGRTKDAGEDDATDTGIQQAPATARWERTAGTAEAEAAETDGRPATPAPSLYKVTVTAFTEENRAAFHNALSHWSPISRTLAGTKQTRSVIAHVQPMDIGTALQRLGEAMDESRPARVSVSVEL